MTAYCTNTDVKVYVGTAVSDADLTAMIVNADAQILAFLTSRGVVVDTAVAKQASILMTRAMVAERLALTGEAPTSYSTGDYSQSGAADFFGLAKTYRDQAMRLLNESVSNLGTTPSSLSDTTRADAVMGDFKLDQTDDPVFSEETSANWSDAVVGDDS